MAIAGYSHLATVHKGTHFEPLGELLLVLYADHLEEVEVAVEGLVLVLAQLLHHRLDAQHEELVPVKRHII